MFVDEMDDQVVVQTVKMKTFLTTWYLHTAFNKCVSRSYFLEAVCKKNHVKTDADLAPFAKTIFH